MRSELRQALDQVAHRFRHLRLWSSLAVCWIIAAAVVVALNVSASRSAQWLAAVAALTALIGGLCAVAALRSARDRRWVARQIEAKHPALGTGLLAAVEEDASGRQGFLQAAVIRDAVKHSQAIGWDETVPSWKLRGSQFIHAAALGVFLIVFAELAVQIRMHPAAAAPSGTAIAEAADVKVDPGDTEIERGSTLLVVARFGRAVPPEATLVAEGLPEGTARRPMTRSLEDPMFAGRVESVAADLAYHVEFAGRSTPTYRVRVFEYPELERTDAKLVFPGYTAIEPKTVEDIRHVTAVEGTELTLVFRLNKDVATARLVDAEGTITALSPHDEGKYAYRATLTLTDSRRFKVQLVDREGRSNKLPAEIAVNVTRNKPATVVMTQPSHDVRVSPVEELTLKANVEDDFGVVRHGVSYTMAGREPREIELAGSGPKVKKLKAEQMLAFESFKAVPDQLLTYFVWAEDIGPDGQPRRTSSDMFFAEVRHFEEIFRQGEAPPSSSSESEDQEQQNGTAQQSEKLAELQKEIINGTWKLIRREIGSKLSDKFLDDSKLLQESQHSALEQAEQLAEKLQDAASKASLDQAIRLMKDAESRLTEAVDSASIKPHGPALAAEQAAYQALLKLRAREFAVVRNNSRQRQRNSRSSAGSPSQRQLNQLELSNEENRYEEQKAARASTQREQEQRETRQVVNRLKELAQRQSDLNDRVKELQSALESAKDEKAREEIERDLKRLRDQQQQVLRDTDELRERMEREENRERMTEAREQIEESREHVRKASEALDDGKLAQAVTEGARAGRGLNDLREDLRKKSADRFSEEMTEMRDQARHLDDDQKKLTEQLEASKGRASHSLRDSGDREKVQEGLGQQQKQLGQLLDRMRNTVQDAEETEPLLAKELFEAVRKANEQAIPNALKVAERLVRANVPEEATKASKHAGKGLEQLREGVERAAKSVLGDETAALRRAQDEVENLADQINREIALASGRDPSDRTTDPNRARPQPGRNGQTGSNESAARLRRRNLRKPGDQHRGGEPRGQKGQQKGPTRPAERTGRPARRTRRGRTTASPRWSAKGATRRTAGPGGPGRPAARTTRSARPAARAGG